MNRPGLSTGELSRERIGTVARRPTGMEQSRRDLDGARGVDEASFPASLVLPPRNRQYA